MAYPNDPIPPATRQNGDTIPPSDHNQLAVWVAGLLAAEPELQGNKGANNGYAGLDSSGHVLVAALGSAKPFGVTVGDGTTLSFVANHNFGTSDVFVQVFDTSALDIVYPTVKMTDVNNVTVTFGTAPVAGGMRILIGRF